MPNHHDSGTDYGNDYPNQRVSQNGFSARDLDACLGFHKTGVQYKGLGNMSWSSGFELHLCYEPVPLPGKVFNETRVLGRIIQRLAQAVHGLFQALLVIDKGIRRPEMIHQGIASHKLPPVLD